MPEEKNAPKKSRYNQSQNKATQKYVKAHYDSILFRVPKGKRDLYHAAAVKRGMSLNAFIVQAVERAVHETETETE